MIFPRQNESFYASVIVVKAEDNSGHTSPGYFALDIEVAGDWVPTDLLPESTIAEIRAAAAAPLNNEGVTFTCILLRRGTPMTFLVDNVTKIKDEW